MTAEHYSVDDALLLREYFSRLQSLASGRCAPSRSLTAKATPPEDDAEQRRASRDRSFDSRERIFDKRQFIMQQQPGMLKHPLQGRDMTASRKLANIIQVKCKDLSAIFHADKYKSGSEGKCIQLGLEWMTPNEFEERSGSKAKKYLSSIKYQGRPLREFVSTNQLGSGHHSVERHKATKSSGGGSSAAPDVNGGPRLNGVLSVSCKYTNALLHTDKYESGAIGKCIQLGAEWLTPNEFEIRSGSKAKKYLNSIKYQGRSLRIYQKSGQLRTRHQQSTDGGHGGHGHHGSKAAAAAAAVHAAAKHAAPSAGHGASSQSSHSQLSAAAAAAAAASLQPNPFHQMMSGGAQLPGHPSVSGLSRVAPPPMSLSHVMTGNPHITKRL